MNRLWLAALLPLLCTACQNAPLRKPLAAADAALAAGLYDNHEQARGGRETASLAVPRASVRVEPTARPGWVLWHVRYGGDPPLEATWAMLLAPGSDGGGSVLPHRPARDAATTGAGFDPGAWVALEPCRLQGEVGAGIVRVAAGAAACTALVPGIGQDAALLPLAIEAEGEWLRVGFYADQARGAQAREALRRVRIFGGWAAVNGSGPDASPGEDWHLQRDLRIGSEGGRARLHWRDGGPSGWSLVLERLAYREGNVPVLKLSVVEDAGGRTLAYAWADPAAHRIGLSLGWLQVGLEEEGGASPP